MLTFPSLPKLEIFWADLSLALIARARSVFNRSSSSNKATNCVAVSRTLCPLSLLSSMCWKVSNVLIA